MHLKINVCRQILHRSCRHLRSHPRGDPFRRSQESGGDHPYRARLADGKAAGAFYAWAGEAVSQQEAAREQDGTGCVGSASEAWDDGNPVGIAA